MPYFPHSLISLEGYITDTFHLPAAYSIGLLRRIWQATNAEAVKVGGGRDRFADHVASFVEKSISEQNILLPDGESYSPPDGGLHPKTIYNFLKRDDEEAIFRTENGHAGISRSTVRYLHVFLIGVRPDVVRRWMENEHDVPLSVLKKIPEFSELSDKYETVNAREFIPLGIKILAPIHKGGRIDAETPKKYIEYITIGKKTDLYSMAVFLIFDGPYEGVVRFVYFEGGAWDQGLSA